MELSIVLLHHGDPGTTSLVLEALNFAELPASTELILVNNGFRGANEEIRLPKKLSFKLEMLEIPNKGYPNGMNVGLNRAKGKYLCMLTDVIVRKDTLARLLAYLKAHPKVGVVAPRLLFEDGETQDNFRSFPNFLDLVIKRTFLKHIFKKRFKRYLMWNKSLETNEAVDWLTGAIHVLTRECWESVGPNDERYFLFMSDVDLCKTAWAKGFEVHFVGEAEAVHKSLRLSHGGFFSFFTKKSMRIHVLDAMKYFWKYL